MKKKSYNGFDRLCGCFRDKEKDNRYRAGCEITFLSSATFVFIIRYMKIFVSMNFN